jgi:hypothetical protein
MTGARRLAERGESSIEPAERGALAEALQGAYGSPRRFARCGERRGGGAARTQRRRQDDMLLHDRRTRRGRRRANPARRRKPFTSCDPSTRAPGTVVSAAGGVDLPQAHRRRERACHPGAADLDPDTLSNRLDALLEDLSISHLADAPAVSLSGGERRRCEIARALATRPGSSSSTSRSPVSTRSPCWTSSASSGSSRSAASAC